MQLYQTLTKITDNYIRMIYTYYIYTYIHIIYTYIIYFYLFGCGERALLSAWTIKTSSNWHALQKSSIIIIYRNRLAFASHDVITFPAVINEFAALARIYLLICIVRHCSLRKL